MVKQNHIPALTNLFWIYERSSIMHFKFLSFQILVGSYITLSSIVCLNLYIALMADTFARVYQNAKANAMLQQSAQILKAQRFLSKQQKIDMLQIIHEDCAPLVSWLFFLFLLNKVQYNLGKSQILEEKERFYWCRSRSTVQQYKWKGALLYKEKCYVMVNITRSSTARALNNLSCIRCLCY